MKTRAELQDALRALDEAEKAANAVKNKERSEAWQVMMKDPDSHEWSTVIKMYTPWGDDGKNLPEREGLIVQKRVRPDVAHAFRLKHGDLVDEKMVQWRGMRYHRTDENILTHDSGGWCVLNDPMLCSDQEWAQMVAGTIPTKYMR